MPMTNVRVTRLLTRSLHHCIFVEVKIVKQMPAQTPGKKPTVAIITSKYYEKLAVDAMMDDKTTFVKYKTEGKIDLYVPVFIPRHFNR